MRNLRINRVVNVTDTIENVFEKDNIRYLKIEIDDREGVDIIEEFEKFYKFISRKASDENPRPRDQTVADKDRIVWQERTIDFDFKKKKIVKIGFKDEKQQELDDIENKAKRKNLHRKIFVHCQMGRSRSCSLVTMYIMYKFKMSADDAFNFVQSRRIVVDPNKGFRHALERFEEMIKNGYRVARSKKEENGSSQHSNQRRGEQRPARRHSKKTLTKCVT
mmetsp:Transcript_19249/g.29521  ORF Transcript_19249/g.29521 Transcript_19249/m.29521 type:complete len:220 (-) Transcript_19249:72-731(-)